MKITEKEVAKLVKTAVLTYNEAIILNQFAESEMTNLYECDILSNQSYKDYMRYYSNESIQDTLEKEGESKAKTWLTEALNYAKRYIDFDFDIESFEEIIDEVTDPKLLKVLKEEYALFQALDEAGIELYEVE